VQLLCYAYNIKDKQSVGAPGHKAPGLKQLGKNPRTQQHGPAANLKGASLFIVARGGANEMGLDSPEFASSMRKRPTKSSNNS
jgi:hypothetical protein